MNFLLFLISIYRNKYKNMENTAVVVDYKLPVHGCGCLLSP